MLKKLLMFAITSGLAAKLLQRVLERNEQRSRSNGPPDPTDEMEIEQPLRSVRGSVTSQKRGAQTERPE
jgi:hypothetical protein